MNTKNPMGIAKNKTSYIICKSCGEKYIYTASDVGLCPKCERKLYNYSRV